MGLAGVGLVHVSPVSCSEGDGCSAGLSCHDSLHFLLLVTRPI